MGQPRPEEEAMPLPAFDEADAFGKSFGKAWATWRQALTPPPAPPRRAPREADQLAVEAARAKQEAIDEGRATPSPAADRAERARAEQIARMAADEETPDELARAAEAGTRRAHARLARIAGRSSDSHEE
jgi:hypothetical protein